MAIKNSVAREIQYYVNIVNSIKTATGNAMDYNKKTKIKL